MSHFKSKRNTYSLYPTSWNSLYYQLKRLLKHMFYSFIKLNYIPSQVNVDAMVVLSICVCVIKLVINNPHGFYSIYLQYMYQQHI